MLRKPFINGLMVIFGFGILHHGLGIANTCQNFNLDRNYFNKRMFGHVIINMTMNHYDCARNCMLLSACESINYKRDYFCELNGVNSSTSPHDIQQDPGFIYSDISTWPENMVGTCGGRLCPIHQRCVPTHGLPHCLDIDCGPPPFILYGILNDSATTHGRKIQVSCEPEYVVIGPEVIECQINGNWSEMPICREPASCQEVQKCNPQYTADEHFWLLPLPFQGQRVKVYCYGMGTSVPQEFITVDPSTNTAYDSGRTTSGLTITFSKIAVNIETMVIIQGNYTFANPNFVLDNGYGPLLGYGIGSGCKGSTMGSFFIDTSNTGVIVDTTIGWVTHGYATVDTPLYRSTDGTTITKACGGSCGFCYPLSELVLHHNPNDVVSDMGVKTPLCIYNE